MDCTYLDKLNPEQRQAAEHGIGAGSAGAPPLLIIAGADPRRILLMTFSRRAAAESAQRVARIGAAALGTDASTMSDALTWSGSFHAIGACLLREYAEQIGLDPGFTVHDREDSADLMNLARHGLGLSQTERRFPTKATCLAIYSRAVDAEMPLVDVLYSHYARVSKGDEQNNALQAKSLRAAGCHRVFEEAASGGRWDRPELHRMLDQLREGDTVVVWKLDRLSRSLKGVLHIMERIAEVGAGFRSITENIDTTTPAGRMMMQMVGSLAEFERAMIHARTSAGPAAARAEDCIGGRRKKLDPAKRREIAESVLSGRKSGADMVRLYSVSQPTVSRIVSEVRSQQIAVRNMS